MKRGPVKNLTGQVFGRLTVLRVAGQTSRGVWKWRCICSCSEKNQKDIAAGNLRSGSTKSCGCLAKENARQQWPKGVLHRIKPGSLLRQLMGHYKQGAERRGLEFSLTFDEFKKLVFGDCFYCGAEPTQIYRHTRYVTSLRYNGIDRVENPIGYRESNCVSCCKNCNQMKSNLSKKEFFQIVLKIYLRHIAGDVE